MVVGSSRGLRVAGSFGVCGGLGLITTASPVLGAMLLGCGVVIMALVVVTALFGSEVRSDRAFRLLRWVRGTAEPGRRRRQEPR